MCQKSSQNDGHDPLWFKRPFFFSNKNLKGLDIYKKILKFLYYSLFNGSQSMSCEEYSEEMLKFRPFKLVFKHTKRVQH